MTFLSHVGPCDCYLQGITERICEWHTVEVRAQLTVIQGEHIERYDENSEDDDSQEDKEETTATFLFLCKLFSPEGLIWPNC